MFSTTRTTILHQPSANSLLWKKRKRERTADDNNKEDERRKLGRRNVKGMRMFGNIMTGVMT